MALPYIFASLTGASVADIDTDLAALGAICTIPCATGGTANALILTPASNTPSVPAFASYMIFGFIAAATNTGAMTVSVAGLASLNVYKDSGSGPVALAGGEIIADNYCELIYDPALSSGTGGFHLSVSAAGATSGTVTNVATGTGLTGGPITTTGTLSLATIATANLLANISGSNAAPIATTLTALLDNVFASTEGAIIQRGASVWAALAAGASGYFLQSGGASAPNSWKVVSYPITRNVSAAGSTQGTATSLTTPVNEITTTPASSGVIPDLTMIPLGTPIKVFNRGGATLNFYPPSGGAIDGNATNAAVTIANGAAATYTFVSATQGYTEA